MSKKFIISIKSSLFNAMQPLVLSFVLICSKIAGETRMNKKKMEELSFEEALEALEDTVERLSDSSTTLDQTLVLYSEGVKYLNRCRAKLTEVEAKITLISEGLPPRSETSEPKLLQEDDNGYK